MNLKNSAASFFRLRLWAVLVGFLFFWLAGFVAFFSLNWYAFSILYFLGGVSVIIGLQAAVLEGVRIGEQRAKLGE
jgi:hypothetical protein